MVLEERRQRVENDPGAILDIYADATLFFNHPYRRPIIGWENEIRDLAVADVLAFYRRWYAPNNAILVVAGDVTAEEVRPLAERFYGGIPRADTPKRTALQEPPAITPRRVELSDPRVRQETWSRSYIAPSAVYGATERADPLEVLARILGGGPSSRLYRKLVVEDGLADQAKVWYEADMRGPSQFVIAVQPREGVSLAAIETAVDAVVADVISAGVSAEDVRAGEAAACRRRLSMLATPSAMARRCLGARWRSGSRSSTSRAGRRASPRSPPMRSTPRRKRS